MTWFILSLDSDMKYRYFIDLDGLIRKSDLPKYARSDRLINSLRFTGVANQTQVRMDLNITATDEIKILLSTIGFSRDDNLEYVEWFKLGFAFPDQKVNVQVEKRVKIATLGFIWLMLGAVILVLALLVFCYFSMRKFSDSISM